MGEFNILDEITKRIQEEEDNTIAKAFTLYIGDLLIRNGIKPIITKVEMPIEMSLTTHESQIVSRYGYIFERLDTSEHDKQIRNEVIEEIKEWVLTSRPDTVSDYKCSDGVVRSRPLYDCATICTKLEKMKGEQNE